MRKLRRQMPPASSPGRRLADAGWRCRPRAGPIGEGETERGTDQSHGPGPLFWRRGIRQCRLRHVHRGAETAGEDPREEEDGETRRQAEDGSTRSRFPRARSRMTGRRPIRSLSLPHAGASRKESRESVATTAPMTRPLVVKRAAASGNWGTTMPNPTRSRNTASTTAMLAVGRASVGESGISGHTTFHPGG